MHFRAEHRFDAPPAAVAAVLVDRRFHEALELPDVGRAELVSLDADADADADAGAGVDPGDRDSRSDQASRLDPTGRGHVVVVRYEYTGELDPLARRLLGGSRLAWTQTLRLEASADEHSFSGSLVIHMQSSPALLRARAAVQLEPFGGAGARRIVEGELVVALPGVGRMAERRLVPGVLRRLDVEAAALARWLR